MGVQTTDQNKPVRYQDMFQNVVDSDGTRYFAQINQFFKLTERNNANTSFSYRMIKKDTTCRLQWENYCLG